jgi:uncharacterized protein (UPF0332 family)
LTVPNPQHLLEQANLLSSAQGYGRPRQVDLRRAISSAYYAVFHQVLSASADEIVGRRSANRTLYTLAYRSVDHATVRRICEEFSRPKPSAKLRKYLPAKATGQTLREFSNIFLRLQSLRHLADYDPSEDFSAVDAMYAISLAADAIAQLQAANSSERKLFLTLHLFPPR